MPLCIEDDATAKLVAQLARQRGLSKQAAVRTPTHASARAAILLP